MGDEAPAEVRAAAAGLRHVSVRCVHIGVGRENLTEKHWIYYPEDTVFHRIFVQGNASPHCNPPGGFGLTCEITYSPHKPLPCDGDDADPALHRGLPQGRASSSRTTRSGRRPGRHAVRLRGLRPRRGRRTWQPSASGWRSTTSCWPGRYSEWEYYNSDHAFLAGKKAAEQVKALDAKKEMASESWTPSIATQTRDAA